MAMKVFFTNGSGAWQDDPLKRDFSVATMYERFVKPACIVQDAGWEPALNWTWGHQLVGGKHLPMMIDGYDYLHHMKDPDYATALMGALEFLVARGPLWISLGTAYYGVLDEIVVDQSIPAGVGLMWDAASTLNSTNAEDRQVIRIIEALADHGHPTMIEQLWSSGPGFEWQEQFDAVAYGHVRRDTGVAWGNVQHWMNKHAPALGGVPTDQQAVLVKFADDLPVNLEGDHNLPVEVAYHASGGRLPVEFIDATSQDGD